MFRNRRASEAGAQTLAAFPGFRRTLGLVEEGKRRLVAAAPGGRRTGVPLAEALAGFEESLGGAVSSMAGWRIPPIEEAWLACARGLEEAAQRAERLRQGHAPHGYEELYGLLGDLMEPLESFAAAMERFRELGA